MSGRVGISSIITQTDDESLNKKAVEVNNSLKMLSRSNGLDFIFHRDINSNCLSRDALHLNRKAVFHLASNLRK